MIDDHTQRTKELEVALDKWKVVEKEQQDSINEEAKQMEKLANKRSLLLKKVPHSRRISLCSSLTIFHPHPFLGHEGPGIMAWE